MSRSRKLRALFTSASSFVLLAHCGGAVESSSGGPGPNGTAPGPSPSTTPSQPRPTSPTSPPTPVSPTPNGRNLCQREEHLSFSPFVDATLGAPIVDSVELRDEPYETQPGNFVPEMTLLAEHGQPCGAATNPTACKNAYAAVHVTAGWTGYAGGQLAPARRYFVHTRGNDVGVATDIVGFRRIFGAVDTLGEAALIATLEDYRFDCEEGSTAPNAFEETGAMRLEMLYATDWTCPRPDARTIRVDRQGTITVVSSKPSDKSFGCAGRRFEGFAAAACEPTSVGEWLAQTAELEAASVPAFERLARELEAHGAPRRLVLSAQRAREDEVRHAALMSAQAQRYGVEPRAVDAPHLPVRALFEVALENAVEGCVREAFAALVAHVQAARAATPALRETFRKIAVDETRHAALAHSAAEWMATRLSPAACAMVTAARERAVATLRAELIHAPDAVTARALGLPDATEALALLALVEPALAAA